MYTYKAPDFDFSAPKSLAKRANTTVPNNLDYRSDFMRDRDRVLYCNSFRRLSGKTQIYRTGIDDHRRNRLSHTLEVSQIARTISHALKLNCDLTEAIALAHDLGHTPFGHAGEQILHEIMVPGSTVNIKKSPLSLDIIADTRRKSALQNEFLFGFKHNLQSVRVVATLEDVYGEEGLNLTNYTLWGILHHSSIEYKEGRVVVEDKYLAPNYIKNYSSWLQQNGSSQEAWSFEAFVVAIADEIAQWHHDLEDALRSHAMTPKEVCSLIEKHLLVSPDSYEEEKLKLSTVKSHHSVTKQDLAILSQIVINCFVNQIIECSIGNLQKIWESEHVAEKGLETFFASHSPLQEPICNAIALKEKAAGKEFADAISEKIHHSSEVERMNAKGQYIVKKLFQAYFAHPQQLPDSVVYHYMVAISKHSTWKSKYGYNSLDDARSKGIGAVRSNLAKLISSQDEYNVYNQILLMRSICDHIANMTDNYAVQEYSLLYA